MTSLLLRRAFFQWASALVLVLPIQMVGSGMATAADPNGSRYDNWDQNAVWAAHYGRYTDGGWVASKYPRMLGDVNGDGKQDVVAFGEDGVYVSVSDGSQFVGSGKWVSNLSYDQGWRVGEHPRYTNDINGDGKADVAGFGDQGVFVGLSTGTAFSTVTQWTNDFGRNSNNSVWDPATTIRVFADVNGDGKADAVGFGKDGVYVGIADPANNRFLPMVKWVANFGIDQAWQVSKHVRLLGDVNGDGKADIVGFGDAGTWVSIAADGKFLDPVMVVANFGADQYWTNDKHVRLLADVNGDGLVDLIGFGDVSVFVSISKGDQGGWNFLTVSSEFAYNSGWRVDRHVRLVTDVNGDGKADIVGFADTGVQFALALGQNDAITYGPKAQWINDFGYNQEWRVGEYPRYMADVNGDGRPEPVGFGLYGVYVSPSASLYCCDTISFLDAGKQNQQVNGAVVARAFLPKSQLIVPTATNPGNCTANANYKNPLEPVVSNGSFGKAPWTSFYTARLMMNANFFDINSGNPNDPLVQCTTALGYTISNTVIISPFSQVHSVDTQTMAFFTPSYSTSSGNYVDILGQNAVVAQMQNIQNAISGFKLLSDGQYVQQPAGINPDRNHARAGVGVSKDGKTIILTVVNNGNDGGAYPNGGVTLNGLAMLLKSLGSENALTLDGSGSAQMGFDNGTKAYKSVGSDSYDSNSNLFRAVPVFLGVR